MARSPSRDNVRSPASDTPRAGRGFQGDSIVRRIADRARRRHEDQNTRRLRTVSLLSVGLLLLILAGPALASFFSVGHSSLASWSRDRGLELTDGSVRVGWITPLRLTDVRWIGPAGSSIAIAEVQTPLTLLDLIQGDTAITANAPVRVRGVQIDGTVNAAGESSLAFDLPALMGSDPADPAELTAFALELEDVAVRLAGVDGRPLWAAHHVAGTVIADRSETLVRLAAVIDAPDHPGGSASASIAVRPATGDADVELRTESLPLSIAHLMPPNYRPRSWPTDLSGDATGDVRVRVIDGRPVSAEVERLVLREIAVQMPAEPTGDGSVRQPIGPIWRLETATIDGTVRLDRDRVVADRLTAASDFASLRLDGSIGRSVSLTGTADNPLAWLQSIDGQLDLDVDLAALQRAMPGTLPVRPGVTIGQGDLSVRGPTGRRRFQPGRRPPADGADQRDHRDRSRSTPRHAAAGRRGGGRPHRRRLPGGRKLSNRQLVFDRTGSRLPGDRRCPGSRRLRPSSPRAGAHLSSSRSTNSRDG